MFLLRSGIAAVRAQFRLVHPRPWRKLPLIRGDRATEAAASSLSPTTSGKRNISSSVCNAGGSSSSLSEAPPSDAAQNKTISTSEGIARLLVDDDEADDLLRMRTQMFPDSGDGVAHKLFEAADLSTAFAVIQDAEEEGEGGRLSMEATAQAIATIFSFCQSQLVSPSMTPTELDDLLTSVRRHPAFRALHESHLNHYLDQFPLDVAAYTFLCLCRLQVEPTSATMTRLHVHLRRKVDEMDLKAISLFCTAFRFKKLQIHDDHTTELAYVYGNMAHSLPRLRALLETASTNEEIRSLFSALTVMHRLLSEDFERAYVAKLRTYLADLERKATPVEREDVELLVKTLHLRRISHPSASLLRDVFKKIQGNLSNLPMHKVMTVEATASKFLPYAPIIHEAREVLWQNYQCYRDDASPRLVDRLNIFGSLVEGNHPLLTEQDVKNYLKDYTEGTEANSCQRSSLTPYKRWQNRIYRSVPQDSIESTATNVLLFSHLAATLEDPDRDSLSDDILAKYEAAVANASPYDIKSFSNSLRIRVRLSIQIGHPVGESSPLLETLIIGLSRRVKTLLANWDTLNVEDTKCLLGAMMNLQYLSEKTDKVFGFDSLLRRESWRILNNASLSPEDKLQFIFTYIKLRYYDEDVSYDQLDQILSTTVACGPNVFSSWYFVILNVCVKNSHPMEGKQEFLENCAKALQRDWKFLTSGTALRMCRSLARYDYFTPDLAKIVFSKSFMEHLDRQSKVTKATVGQGDGHVRRQLFRLNRTVCLKYPEYGVPWFHEKYCLEMQRHWVAPTAVAPVIDDIYQHLCKAAGGREYVGVDVCSPYFFSLDFEVYLNKDTGDILSQSAEPIQPESSNPVDIIRLAVVINKRPNKNIDINLAETLEGLEILGYRPVVVHVADWNSMNMQVDGALMKVKFFEKLLRSFVKVPRPEHVDSDRPEE